MYTTPKRSVICTDATDQDAYGFFFYIYIRFVHVYNCDNSLCFTVVNVYLGLKNVSWDFSGSFLAVKQKFLCMICINMSTKRQRARRNTSHICGSQLFPLQYLCFYSRMWLGNLKKFPLKGEMIFSYRVSQLVCWSNSKIFLLNKRLKCFLVVQSVILVCWGHWCHSGEARIEAIPVHFTMEGRDCLWTGRPSQQLPPLLIERKTVTKKLRMPKTKQKPFKGLPTLWSDIFWSGVALNKSFSLKDGEGN